MNLTTNYTSLQRYNILYRTNEDSFRKLLPTISFCSVLAFLGVAGNMLSIHIFVTRMLKNPQNDLFILLSVFNLLACGVCLPLDILDMRNMYLYPSTVLCKIARFLNMFTMASSTLTLCVLAIFRLRAASSRAVVSPHRSVRFVGLGILVLLSGSVSWLAAVVFGIRSNPTFTEDITGRDCSIADDTSGTAWPVVFNVVLALGFACLLVVTTTAYYRIWRVVKKSRIAVTAHTMTVGVSLGSSGQRKPDLPCYEENVNVSSDDIKRRKADSSSRKENTVNIYYVDSDKLKTILSPQEVNNVTSKISIGQEELKQSIQPTTADSCTDTAPANVALSDDSSKDMFTPIKNNTLLITDIINIALINADGTVNNDDMTKKSLLNTDGTAKNARVNNVINNGRLHTDSTFVCKDMGGDQVISRIEQNFKTKQHYRDNPDFSVTGNLWENKCNPNSTTFSHDSTKPSNMQQHRANADKQFNIIINGIAKDIFSMDLKTAPSTGKASLNKQEQAGHVLKVKLSKTSLEAAVTRTAFLLTLTFIVSYLPFFFVSIPRAIDRNFDYSQDALMMNLVNTVLRLYFIMPVVSPAIFWASNLDFRRKCKALCAKNNFVVN